MAAVVALEYFKVRAQLRSHSNSQYITRGACAWLDGWRGRGWRKAKNKPLEHVDLWRRVHVQTLRHAIDWEWIRAHNGDQFNELADRLANEAAERAALGVA